MNKKLLFHAALLALFGLVFTSCSRQYHLEFAGKYHPDVKTTQQVVSNSVAQQDQPMTVLSQPAIEPLTATTDNSAPVMEQKTISPPMLSDPLTDRQQKQVNRIVKKVEKVAARQIEKQNIVPGNLPHEQQSNVRDDNQLVAAIIAFFLPWLGVLVYEGELTSHFWIALLLWLLFWLPGFIYALTVIF